MEFGVDSQGGKRVSLLLKVFCSSH